MNTILKGLCATSMLALVTACSTPMVDKLENTKPAGSAFNQQLTQEYKVLARFEADDMQDFHDAGHFAEKGIAASQNQPTKPDDVWARNVPKKNVTELTTARSQLVEVLDQDAGSRYPQEAATAQAKFDCWLEQQEENYQPAHIAACRNAFNTAMQTIRSKEQARMTSDKQTADVSRSADRTDPEMVVFFDFDSATITSGEASKINRIAEKVSTRESGFTVVATGHADRAGSYEYNKALSVRRAEAVKDALIDRGVTPSVIVIDGKGEMEPLDATGDGVRDADNRRVKVSIR